MKDCKLCRFTKDGLVSDSYLIFKGEKGIVISETDCCHFIIMNDKLAEHVELNIPMHYKDNIFHVEFKSTVMSENQSDVELINNDPELISVVHYFGIKERIRQNYEMLKSSLELIEYNYIHELPEWKRLCE